MLKGALQGFHGYFAAPFYCTADHAVVIYFFTCRGVLVLPALSMNGMTSKNKRITVVSHMHIGRYTQDHPPLV